MRGLVRTLGFLTFVVFGGVLAVSVWDLAVDSWGLAHWPHVTATAVDDHDGHTVYRLTDGGRTREVTSRHSRSLSYGTSVEIAVDPDDETLIAERIDAPWAGPLICALLSGLGLWIYRRADRSLAAEEAAGVQPASVIAAPTAAPAKPEVASGGDTFPWRTLLAIGWVCAVIGPLLLGPGVYLYWRARAQWQNLPHVEAEVLETHRVFVGSNGWVTYTTYHYDYRGRGVTTKVKLDRGQRGDLVDLIIDPEHPGRVMMNPVDVDVTAAALPVMGGALLVLGLLLIRFGRQGRQDVLSEA